MTRKNIITIDILSSRANTGALLAATRLRKEEQTFCVMFVGKSARRHFGSTKRKSGGSCWESEGETMLKIERYDDYPKIKKQAEQILDRIMLAVELCDQRTARKPVVVMSQDNLSILCKGLPDIQRVYARSRRMEIAGQEVILTLGTNKLFIGFEI